MTAEETGAKRTADKGADWPPPPADFAAPYAPLRVSPERILGVRVGVRPYRPQGFTIRAEKFGGKIVIHNYGHGGCGVTLAYGCADLAMQAAAPFAVSDAAVIGAGVIGVTTALALLRRGARVTIYAERTPPETTSDIAAALWEPTSLFDPDAVDDVFFDRFRFAARRSHEMFRRLAGAPRYGVRWIRRLTFRDAPPGARRVPAIEGDDLYPGAGAAMNRSRWFGFPYTDYHQALMIDAGRFMAALLADAERAGAQIVHRRLDALKDVEELKESVVFNCTGYGARALFGDETLAPARGQLVLLAPQPEVDYGYVHESPDGLLYMFPRMDSIVLGGSFDYGDGSVEPREAETARILSGHAAIAERMKRQYERRD
ncbi:MAG: FAD-dependent oxidoreductase [Pseudomonadota bacterium]|nr:FAD-dependent oxidoreductase [Pseudomonadota bacterium]